MKKHLLILTLCFSSFLFAQNQVKIDSLENALGKAKNDSVKVNTLTSLFQEYMRFDIEKAKSYNDKQFELAHTTKDDYVYSMAHYMKGFYYYYISEFDSVVINMRKALSYAEKAGSPDMIISVNNRLGSIYIMMSENDSALYYINKTIELSKKYGDEINFANAHLEKGNYFLKQMKGEEALKNYLVVDSVLSNGNHKNNHILIASQLNISNLYIDLKNYDKAEFYANKAKKIAEKVGNIEHIINSETLFGRIALYRKDYKTADEKFKKVLEFHTSSKNKFREADALFLLGLLNGEQNKTKEAKKYYEQAISIRKEIDDIPGMNVALQNLGAMYFNEKNYAESRKYYTEALETARIINNLDGEANSLKHLAEINYQTQNYKAASEFYKEYIPLQDSLTNGLNFEKVAELETKYQTAKKEQQIELLSAENQLGKQKRKNQFTIFAALVGLLLIVGAALAFAYRNKLRTAEKVRELNQMKSRFFANISHEFRTPLTLIKSPLQNLQAELGDENQQKQLSLIDKNSDRMLELVNQLLELSKIDSGKLKLIIKEGNLNSFLKSIVEPFAYRAKEKNVKFSSNLEIPDGKYSYDKDVIEKIVSNLLSNAVKYTPENNEVKFNSNVEGETLKIKVSNSGSNLKNKDLPKLFERFHQTDDQNEGFGIGLALIKELVDLYKGKIETTINDGVLSFLVSLPLTQSESENIVIHKDSYKSEEIILQSEHETNGERLVLLIVDDNAEIRNVVKELFSENYTILEAEDGVSALKLAQKEIPDCIISDVMMPKMDGFEFTKAVKENELTSFIPVILLTAKTADEARLESLKSEADAFLTKPFHNEILKESVYQLIAERKKLRERYSRELILKPVDIVINSVDEKFLEKLGIIMEKQISNTGFSTDDFASELGMSRMQLHRKLKSLLNVSTTEFIRNERLKAAVELMKKGNKNVSEIAYTVGFNDVSYFSKSFKDLYNVTPSEYISNV